MSTCAPALLAISHGTDSAAGRAAVARLVAAVAERHADTRGGFVDVQQPDIAAVLDTVPAAQPAVVVPLLLSAGFHVRVDMTEAADAADRPVTIAGALGPDDALVALLAERLRAIELGDDDVVVLGAAGSSDRLAVADCVEMGVRLGRLLGRPVRTGFLSAARPDLREAVAAAAAKHPGRRVVIASYLLAPGYFFDLLRTRGADAASEPLLPTDGPPPDALVDVVLRRYQAACERAAAVRGPGPLTAASPA